MNDPRHRYVGGAAQLRFPKGATITAGIGVDGVDIQIDAGRKRLSFWLPLSLAQKLSSLLKRSGIVIEERPR